MQGLDYPMWDFYVVEMSEICESIYLGKVEHMRPIGHGMRMNAHSDIVLN